MRSLIFSQCRDFRTEMMWEDFGVLVTARAREFWMFWTFFYLRLWKTIVQWVAVVKFRMNDRSGGTLLSNKSGSIEERTQTIDNYILSGCAVSAHT